MKWQKGNNGFISVVFVVIIVLLLGGIGGYYFLKQNPQREEKPFYQHQKENTPTTTNTQNTTSSQKYFSCLQIGGNNKLNELEPYKKGSLVFKAKDGTSEETILNKLKPLGYDLKTVNSTWGYSGIDRSTLFIRHTMKPEEAQSAFKPIVNKFEIVEGFPTGFYYETATVYFTKILSKEQQQSVNEQLDNLKTQRKVTEYGWNYAPKQLYGFLAAPAGREEEYIEKLNNLGIFDCVSKELNTIPYMPVVPQ